MTDVQQTIEDYLAETELEWELGARDGEFVVSLPGERKLKTVVSLLVGENALTAPTTTSTNTSTS